MEVWHFMLYGVLHKKKDVMNFQIVEKSFDGPDAIELKNRWNGEYVTIFPAHTYAGLYR